MGEASVADLTLTSYRDDEHARRHGPAGLRPIRRVRHVQLDGIGWEYEAPGTGALEQGGFGLITIIHELGHGLGLAHPHDKGGRSGVFPV